MINMSKLLKLLEKAEDRDEIESVVVSIYSDGSGNILVDRGGDDDEEAYEFDDLLELERLALMITHMGSE